MPSNSYGKQTAVHYRAYRPPLHAGTLSRVLPSGKIFSAGWDIGCGVGHSSVALTGHCKRVIGTDPNEAMIVDTITHPKISFFKNLELFYLNQVNEQEQNERESGRNKFDLVTLAGVLPYTDRSALANEIQGHALPGAYVLAYDFSVDLNRQLHYLSVDAPEETDYDHAANFSGVTEAAWKLEDQGSYQEYFTANRGEIAHLLLSVENWYAQLAESMGDDDLHERLSARIEPEARLTAKVYYSLYSVD